MGGIGLIILFAFGGDDGSSRQGLSGRSDIRAGDFSSLGERIFLTGRDERGRRIPRSGGFGGMMGDLACADCHGEDARGGSIQMMMYDIEAPDIRWSTLAEPEPEPEPDSGATGGEHAHEPYDEEGFARAIREGVAPGAESLDRLMPRWQVSDRQVQALIEFLREK